MRYHLTPVRIMLERMQRKGNPLHCWWECKLVQPLWKTVWRFLRKLTVELPYNPAIALLGSYPKDINIVIQRALSRSLRVHLGSTGVLQTPVKMTLT
uniref:Uncharacterized protein n=1 Tax=Ursus americanus TaxID=9643 RepID=A0A452QF88_URSAM